MQPDAPKELDWVGVRADCTVARVFKKLEVEVQQDVDMRKSQIPERNPLKLGFSFETHGETIFSVVREGVAGTLSQVQFKLEDEAIIVRGDKQSMKATLTMNDFGECVLCVQDGESATDLRTWQFRKRALERLFFDIQPQSRLPVR